MAAEEGLDEEVGHLVGDGDETGEQDDPEDGPLSEDDADSVEDVVEHSLGRAVVCSGVACGDRRGVETVGPELCFGARRLAQEQGDESGASHRPGADQEDGLEAPESSHRSAEQGGGEQRAGHHRLGPTHVLLVLTSASQGAEGVEEQGVS